MRTTRADLPTRHTANAKGDRGFFATLAAATSALIEGLEAAAQYERLRARGLGHAEAAERVFGGLH